MRPVGALGMPGVEIEFEINGACVGYDGRAVLHDVDLSISRGETIALMGRSGAGKSTLLGLLYDQRRADVALVPQAAALVRPLSVFHNVYMGRLDRHTTLYNLRQLVWPSAAEISQVTDLLADLALADKVRAQAGALSGGQQQRVALARALANRPKVLLLDEPLSALDLKLRKEMQLELKRLHAETGITFVFVTHDQEEALTMSDRIAVMKEGRIQQIGTPTQIYDQPNSRYVADFIGETNFLTATARDGLAILKDGSTVPLNAKLPNNQTITLAIRPERARFGPEGLAATVKDVVYKGTDTLYLLELSDQPFQLRRPNSEGAGQTVTIGQQVRVVLPGEAVRVLEE